MLYVRNAACISTNRRVKYGTQPPPNGLAVDSSKERDTGFQFYFPTLRSFFELPTTPNSRLFSEESLPDYPKRVADGSATIARHPGRGAAALKSPYNVTFQIFRFRCTQGVFAACNT